MNKFLLFFRSLFAYVVFILAISLVILPGFIIACFPERWRYENRLYYLLISFVYKATVFGTLLPLNIEGKENILSESAIFVANHESALDIPVLGSILNGSPHVWLFYVRYAKIPFLGFLLCRMNVVIDPSGLKKLVSSLYKTIEIIKNRKTNVILFPEGGRYTDGTIHNFFYGFALLAKETRRPVIPIMMYNLGKAYPPSAFFIQPFPLKILAGKPFYFEEHESEQEFVNRVQTWFVEKTQN